MPPFRKRALSTDPLIEKVIVSTYTIPTGSPESDGTLSWDHTTLVLVEVHAAGVTGLGFTYADEATAKVIEQTLKKQVEKRSALSVNGPWMAMVRSIRNLGRPGICSMAIAAVDNALWDLKARLLNVPLVTLLGQVHEAVEVYGSGGFTSYSIGQLQSQLGGWAQQGIKMVKMKVGTHPEDDVRRVRAARAAIGADVELFVDVNGAYSRKQALEKAEQFAQFGVRWFEEPVSSDDLDGLRLIRDRAPAQMEIAAGEYGYDSWYFRTMLEVGAVDVLQADATRCAGITGFLKAAALCEAQCMPLSAHTAPAMHLPVCCAAAPLRHLEYFFDHVRIEQMFFEGMPQPVNGKLFPDLSRPGNGLEFKRADAVRFAA